MKRFVLLCLIAALGCLPAIAQMQPTLLRGTAPKYANYQIDLYRSVDPFNLMPQKLGSIVVGPLGEFATQIVLSEASTVYAEFDRWHVSAVLEPGKTYFVQLPPCRPLNEAERRNPYFTQSSVPLGLKALPEDDINRRLQAFEIDFSLIEDKYFDELFVQKSTASWRAFQSEVLQQFPAPSHSFFGRYVYYRLALVDYKLRLTTNNDFIQTYLDVEPMPFNVPPFSQLYNEVFTNYFYHEIMVDKNKELARLLASAKLSKLENYLYKEKNWGDNLRRISILDGINDAYYQNQFPKDVLLDLLRQVSQSDWLVQHKELADALYHRLTYLAEHTDAPDIALEGTDETPTSLKNVLHSEKLNFLHFSNTNNPISRNHLDQIALQFERYANEVNFIIVMPRSCKAKLDPALLATWKGQFFFASEEELAKYKIRTFPYSFLLSKEGKLLLSPALNPLEGMIEQLNAAILQRKQNK